MDWAGWALSGLVATTTLTAEDSLGTAIIGEGSRKGSTLFGRAGDLVQRPATWAAIVASDLAFVFGAAQHLPRAFLPLSACSLAVHWSLVRKRAHYPTDVVAGGALGIAVALAVWKLWPPRTPPDPVSRAS